MNDLDSSLAKARSDLVKFEEILYRVIRGTYDPPWFPQGWADEMVARDPLINMRLVDDFFDRYLEKKPDAVDRLPALTYRLMDIKMQSYFVTKAMPGLHNALFTKSGLDLRDPLATPGRYVDHLCMMQSLIGQVRILWERILSFVYYFEEQEQPRPASEKFFKKLLKWHPRWDAFKSCESQIRKYDKDYRNAEFHNDSILRASLLEDQPKNPNDIMGSMATVTSGFWQVLISNIEGVQPHVVEICPTFEVDGEPSVT